MINGPGYLYVEIPRCGSTYVGDILIEQCGGTRLTPRHDPLTWEVDREKCVVFTTVRNPYTRYPSLWKYMDSNPASFEFWFESFRDREHSAHIGQPYSFWTHNCDKVLKIENIVDTLPPLMKKIGYNIEMPEFKMTKYKLSKDDMEYIREEFKKDFVEGGYTTDMRGRL